MGIRAFLSKPIASIVTGSQNKWAKNPVATQKKVFESLLKVARNTKFGKDHHLDEVNTFEEFRQAVPIRDYEQLSPYIKRVVDGEPDVLWKGKPLYFAKTSGTTSGVKYIPISKDSIPYHINAARDALLNYVQETGKSEFLDGNLMFLSGSPEMEKKNGIYVGRLSGIVNHHVPSYLRTNQKPSYETNCMDDWEAKIEKIIDETLSSNMTLISGIPPWVQMYFDRIIERTGKKIKDVFPNFSLMVYGGVNFEPYKAKLFDSIGKTIDSIETYPASEGFIAFQNSQKDNGLLLLLNSGIYYEFIPAEDYFKENPRRLSIEEVELGVNYAIILNTNAGLWGYSIGDTVKFVSKDPYKIIVSGRIKHFISAFGEHVIGEEVEKAMKVAMEKHPEAEVIEFTVAPQVSPKEGLPYHQWYIEFSKMPENMNAFANDLDQALVKFNTY
ncbi:MAG TPA: GH3 auxin-responsive promoter family protein, partial [Cytophagaceae bacterium]